MARRVLTWALVFVMAWTVSPALAQMASPLKGIPGDAAVVVRVKGLQGSLNKIAALADAVQPGTGNTVKFGGAAIGAGLKNPTMEGVDQAGDFYVAVFVAKDEVPTTLFAVPGKDLDAMEEALGEDVTFLKSNKHGFYSDDEELIDEVKKQLSSKEKDSLADKIGEKSMAVLNRGDISIFVNVPALLEVYKDEFEQAKGFIGTIKDQVNNSETEAPKGVNMSAMADQLQSLANTLVQAVEDHEGITIALSVTEKDIVLEEYFKLNEASGSGKALKASTANDLGLINSLPADSVGYVVVQGNISDFLAWGMNFGKAVISDEKVLEQVSASMEEVKKLKFNGMASSITLNKSNSAILNVASLIATDDPKKFRAISQKYATAVKEMEVNGIKTETTYKPDSEKVGATSIDVLTAKTTISDDAPDAENQRKVQKLMFGEDGMTSRTAYLKDRIVQVLGSKSAMEAALKAAEAGSRTPSASIQAVRSKLGTKPNVIALVDIASATVQGLGIAKQIDEDSLPFDPDQITKGLNLKPSYLGFGVEIQDAAVSVRTVVPVDQIKALFQLSMKLQAAQRGDN